MKNNEMNDNELAAKAEEQLVLHRKEAELHNMKLQADKHRQNAALQERLNARIKAKQEREVEKETTEIGKKDVPVEAPFGNVTFAFVTVKDVVALLEMSDENTALKTLEDIHGMLTEELALHKVYKVREEIGKFLIASKYVEDMLNLSMIIQKKFNEKKWGDEITKLPVFKRLFRPEDTQDSGAAPIFNGPRIAFGIHGGEAAVQLDASGKATYSGLNVIKAETIGNFAQGGQTLLSESTWDKVDKSKLSTNQNTQLGVYKLEGFSTGCRLVEVLPDLLKERTKFFGAVCAHCSKLIQPKEKFFKALDRAWHMNHFRCFNCNSDLQGSFLESEGSPYCKNCFLLKTAPKCKKCSNPVTGGYINALESYWHADCFVCKSCLKKPSADVPIYEYEGYPYCGDCYKEIAI